MTQKAVAWLLHPLYCAVGLWLPGEALAPGLSCGLAGPRIVAGPVRLLREDHGHRLERVAPVVLLGVLLEAPTVAPAPFEVPTPPPRSGLSIVAEHSSVALVGKAVGGGVDDPLTMLASGGAVGLTWPSVPWLTTPGSTETSGTTGGTVAAGATWATGCG